MDYEYEPEMEIIYRQDLFKTFKKNIDNGFFSFIIIDAVNEKAKHFEDYWSYAKSKGFQVSTFICGMSCCFSFVDGNVSVYYCEQVYVGCKVFTE